MIILTHPYHKDGVIYDKDSLISLDLEKEKALLENGLAKSMDADEVGQEAPEEVNQTLQKVEEILQEKIEETSQEDIPEVFKETPEKKEKGKGKSKK